MGGRGLFIPPNPHTPDRCAWIQRDECRKQHKSRAKNGHQHRLSLQLRSFRRRHRAIDQARHFWQKRAAFRSQQSRKLMSRLPKPLRLRLSISQRRQKDIFHSAPRKCFSNHLHASSATLSKHPGSSKRCVAPETISNPFGQSSRS